MIAVVVAYNSGLELARCCNGLLGSSNVEKVIVVDNSYHLYGSALEAIGMSSSSRLVHAIPPRNLGYAGGNNYGLRMAANLGAEIVLVCNPDVEIMDDDLSLLEREMKDRSLHLISPRLIEVDENGSAGTLSSPGWDQCLGRGVLSGGDNSLRKRIKPSFFGACFMAKTELLDQLGGLSEDFFLYCEEMDYCIRMAVYDLGWGISDHVSIRHGRGLSISPEGLLNRSNVSHQHAARSAIVLGRKYWPLMVFMWTINRAFLAILLFVRRDVSGSLAVMKGVVQGWRTRLTQPPTIRSMGSFL